MRILFLIPFFLFGFSLKADDIKDKVNKIYSELTYHTWYNDSNSVKLFRQAILDIGENSVPYLYEAVNKDPDSLKLFAVASVISEIYKKPIYEDIVFYLNKYKSKNVVWLSISLAIHSQMLFYDYTKKLITDGDTVAALNSMVPIEILGLYVSGLKYNSFVVQYLFPVHEAETISSLSMAMIFVLCSYFSEEFFKIEDNNLRINYITNWWNKNKSKIVWDGSKFSFVVKE